MFVEETRRRLREEGVPLPADGPLSNEAVVWLARMRVALCDSEVSTEAVDEMDAAMRQALLEEAEELVRRCGWFTACRDGIPLQARRPVEATWPVYQHLLEIRNSEE